MSFLRKGSRKSGIDPRGRLAHALDRVLVRHTGWSCVSRRATRSQDVPYVATLLLRTTHTRTGQPRGAPAFYGVQDGRYVVVGSPGGHRRDPVWARNLRADPRAVVWVARKRIPVERRLLDGAEREAAWRPMTRLWPAYERYRERARDHRQLPVFALTPLAGQRLGAESPQAADEDRPRGGT